VSSASATCTVTVSNATGAIVTLSSNAAALTVPASVTVGSGGTTAAFTATAGTIVSNQTATLKATLNGSTQTAAISLVAPAITLTPSSATEQNAGTLQFTAAVTGSSNIAVTWSLSPAIGSISSAGFYAAPTFVNSPQSVTVTATSVADPLMSASASVSLQPVGLVGYWPFDESSGVIAHDASGSGNDGTLECNGTCSPLPAWTSGIRNGALNFPAVNDLVSVPDSPDLRLTNQFTVAFWVNSAGAENIAYLEKATGIDLGKGPGATNGFLIAAGGPGNFMYIDLYNNSTRFGRCTTVNGALLPQIWQHFAITYDGANIRMYMNGVLNAACNATGSAGTDATPLQIGGTSAGAPVRTMDEVRIYSRPLSALEVISIYNDPGQ
jgi:hypothetical protein